MKKIFSYFRYLALFSVTIFLTGCDSQEQIVSQIPERDANIIIVFLSSKGIPATKSAAAAGGVGAENTGPLFNINVEKSQMIEAMAILNQNGLPRKQGTTLLDLFAKQGLMSSDKEETIRYQSGLEQQITNTILLIDGVIDATVQLSFPPDTSTSIGPAVVQKTTAAVYVKHQGIIDDPNAHLENKIKRLLSGSVINLDINDVTVVSDRSRFTDISINAPGEMKGGSREFISIWSVVMNKQSAGRFQGIFFSILALAILLAAILGWLIWKIYPLIRRKGLKEWLSPVPILSDTAPPAPEILEENNP
jgi:type III secretion protein J